MGPKKFRGLQGNYVLTVDGQQQPPSTGSRKKKVPKNAFYFYMQDFREAEETKGVFYTSQKEVADAAASSWQLLSEEKRKPYQDAAAEAKLKDKADLHNKFTTEGRSYAEVNREEQERREHQEKMFKEIRGTIRSLRTSPALNNHPFHLIHVNYYCKTTSGVYVPCELALSEFSLLDGVKRIFHVLINPGELPLGYKYDAEKHAEETHRIPLPREFEFDGVIRDYASILQSLVLFLREGKTDYKIPPLYTTTAQIEPCENVLAMLCDSVVDGRNNFRVYPAKEMFFELQHACVDVFKPTDERIIKIPFVSLAEREMEKDIFDYTQGISCTFHEDTDAIPFCSLSCVQRWSFLILDYCHQVTNMPLVPGKHVPQHTNVFQLKKLKQRKVADVQELHPAMEKLQIKTRYLDQLNSEGQQASTSTPRLRAPKEISQALHLLACGDSDDKEIPPDES